MKVTLKVKRGQVYTSKNNSNIQLKVSHAATGNRHWTVYRLDRKSKKSHHIHEGTLLKHYQLEEA